MIRVIALSALLMVILAASPGHSQGEDEGLSVVQIMNAMVVPMTGTLWGAYDIQTDAQWQELEYAALGVVGAGQLLGQAGIHAGNQDWQDFNRQMISAARVALDAIARRDEEELSNAGNDLLYPPCESCHQRYMNQ